MDLQNLNKSRLLYSLVICFVVVTVDCTTNISQPAAIANLENCSACVGIQLTAAIPFLLLISLTLLATNFSLIGVVYIDWINSVAFAGFAFAICYKTEAGFS